MSVSIKFPNPRNVLKIFYILEWVFQNIFSLENFKTLLLEDIFDQEIIYYSKNIYILVLKIASGIMIPKY